MPAAPASLRRDGFIGASSLSSRVAPENVGSVGAGVKRPPPAVARRAAVRLAPEPPEPLRHGRSARRPRALLEPGARDTGHDTEHEPAAGDEAEIRERPHDPAE